MLLEGIGSGIEVHEMDEALLLRHPTSCGAASKEAERPKDGSPHRH